MTEMTTIHSILIQPPVDGELRANGTSNKIQVKAGVIPKMLRDYGFFQLDGGFHYVAELGCGISFNVRIEANDFSDLNIVVVDDDFGQPYDYQYLLMKGEENKVTVALYEKVEAELERLQDAGILTGHVRGDYV